MAGGTPGYSYLWNTGATTATINGLSAGTYSVVEVHPSGWIDGIDAAGRIGGVVVGRAVNPGDRIRVGATLFIFEQEANTGTDTALIAMQDAFKGGKGYSTILREIVDTTEPAAAAVMHVEDTRPGDPEPIRITTKKVGEG